MPMTSICIITALAAESRPFIDTFKLRHLEARGMRLYGNEHCLLLQTGIGKLKAAAATAALLQSHPQIRAIINTGIAGGTEAVGTMLMGHRILDIGSGAQWYPHLPPQRVTSNLTTADIHTVDTPCVEYTPGVLFDMEAAAIFSAASNYLSTDAIHCIKVISDSADESVEAVNSDQVVELMRSTTPIVSKLLDWQSSQNTVTDSTIAVSQLCRDIEFRVHHTVSEKHQLHRLLQQYSNLAGSVPDSETLTEFSSASQLKRYLQTLLSSISLTYGT